MLPKVSIILLNHNNSYHTSPCIYSLQKDLYEHKEIIVVDNASASDELGDLKDQFPDIIAIQQKENSGFCVGMNVGMQYALSHGAHYIFVLHNNVEVDELCITKLVSYARKYPLCGAISPQVLNYHNPVHHLFPKKKQNTLFYKCATLPQYGMFFPSPVLMKVGLFDPDFTFYADKDMCIRIRKKKYSLYCAQDSIIKYKENYDNNSLTSHYVYYKIRTTLFFIKKHSFRRERWSAYVKTIFSSQVTWFVRAIQHRSIGLWLSSHIAIIDFLRGKNGTNKRFEKKVF